MSAKLEPYIKIEPYWELICPLSNGGVTFTFFKYPTGEEIKARILESLGEKDFLVIPRAELKQFYKIVYQNNKDAVRKCLACNNDARGSAAFCSECEMKKFTPSL